MIVIVGAIIVTVSVLGGFLLAGGHPVTLLQFSEWIVICGSALGSLIIMSPKRVLVDLWHNLLQTLKSTPYSKEAYMELFKALYELFTLGRRNGMIALEDHITSPEASNIFSKYPTFIKNPHAVELLCGGLRPIIDGKVKPDQLKLLLETELETLEEE